MTGMLSGTVAKVCPMLPRRLSLYESVSPSNVKPQAYSSTLDRLTGGKSITLHSLVCHFTNVDLRFAGLNLRFSTPYLRFIHSVQHLSSLHTLYGIFISCFICYMFLVIAGELIKNGERYCSEMSDMME